MTKLGLVITNHFSKNRPYGRQLLENAYDSFVSNSRYEFEIVIMDNQSDVRLPSDHFIMKDPRVHYHYVENQWDRGLTGAWNEGIKKAHDLGCKIILNSNDDLVFNETINSFIEKILCNPHKDISIFGPLTNGVIGPWIKNQYSTSKDESKSMEILSNHDVEGLLNGFFFGFTDKFYETFKYENGDLFAEFGKFDEEYIKKYAGTCGKWGGQEYEICRFKEKGGKVFIVGECWIYHLKKRDWRKAKDFYDKFIASKQTIEKG